MVIKLQMEGEKIIESCTAMNMIVGKTIFNKRATHLPTNDSGP